MPPHTGRPNLSLISTPLPETRSRHFVDAHGLAHGPLNCDSDVGELDGCLKSFYGFDVPRASDLYEALLLARQFTEWRKREGLAPLAAKSSAFLKFATRTEYVYAFVRRSGCDTKYVPFVEHLVEKANSIAPVAVVKEL